MQCKNLIASAVVAGAALTTSIPVSAQDVLTGDTRLACEAVLCLATGNRPSECMPSLQRYFSIWRRDPRDTIRDRINFLNLCPASNQTPEMSALVHAMAHGAGKCDAQSLNRELESWSGNSDNGYISIIDNNMPGYCKAYTSHAYTDLASTIPRYVGIPKRHGHWVETRDYDRALAEYNARIKAEDEEEHRRRNAWSPN